METQWVGNLQTGSRPAVSEKKDHCRVCLSSFPYMTAMRIRMAVI